MRLVLNAGLVALLLACGRAEPATHFAGKGAAAAGCSELDFDHLELTRDAVMTQMKAIAHDVTACFAGRGIAQLQFQVEGSTGRVTRVIVEKGPRHDKTCIARAATRVCFAPFRKPLFKISFPFKLD
jgi:hypothetical protein